MDFKAKIAFLNQDLVKRGQRINSCSPPVYRWFWKLGINVKPPVFAGFMPTFMIMSCVLVIAWAFLLGFFLVINDVLMVQPLLLTALITIPLFGIIMTLFWAAKKKKLNLGEWEAYGSEKPSASAAEDTAETEAHSENKPETD